MSNYSHAASCWPLLFTALMVFANQLPSSARAAAPFSKTLLCFGDSLTAGYGLESPATDAFPALLQEKFDALSPSVPRWRVSNAGLSGETTAGGARRIDWILRQPVDIFILALGANDGLRGIAPAVSLKNLQTIIDRVRDRYPAAKIILAGMMMPPILGQDYVREFAAIYPALAAENHLILMPFLLQGVGGLSKFNQSDGIHPSPAGHAIIADNVWAVVKPLL